MLIGNQHYTRREILRRVGNLSQLGGLRQTTLAEGRGKGMACVQFDTGAGLVFNVMPDRGMDIFHATFRGHNLVYHAPGGEAHPALFESQGKGWMRVFFGGLLTTCGLTTLGSPGVDGAESLPQHGLYTAIPARQVCDRSGWEGDDYRLELTGIVEDALPLGHKLRLTRTIRSWIGSRKIELIDVVENFGFEPAPLTVLYHINPGFPLLDAGSELLISAADCEPYDEYAREHLEERFSVQGPQAGYAGHDFLHHAAGDAQGNAWAGVIHPQIEGGLGLRIRFAPEQLPYLSQWKMLGEGQYLVGLEPCNAPCRNRARLRELGALPTLQAGETRTFALDFDILQGAGELESFREQVRQIPRAARRPIGLM